MSVSFIRVGRQTLTVDRLFVNFAVKLKTCYRNIKFLRIKNLTLLTTIIGWLNLFLCTTNRMDDFNCLVTVRYVCILCTYDKNKTRYLMGILQIAFILICSYQIGVFTAIVSSEFNKLVIKLHAAAYSLYYICANKLLTCF